MAFQKVFHPASSSSTSEDDSSTQTVTRAPTRTSHIVISGDSGGSTAARNSGASAAATQGHGSGGRAKNWCFTLNNYTDDEEQCIGDFSENDHLLYMIVGREKGDSGTPHLQGYLSLNRRFTLSQIKGWLGSRVHLEVARGSPQQNRDYCTKEGDYDEYGTLPRTTQGKRNDFICYQQWVVSLDRMPTMHEIAREWPGLFARYSDRLRTIAEASLPPIDLLGDSYELRPWQAELASSLEDPPDPREVMFFVDSDGGKGKSYFCQWLLSKSTDGQVLRIGKRDDLAYAIDETKKIFVFDIPRTQMEYLQYSVLEMLKDRMVFSAKYQSATKILRQSPHVIVFSNEYPDMSKMSDDRYNIKEL